MKRVLMALMMAAVLPAIPPRIARAQHGHGAAKGQASEMETREVVVEGVRVIFQVMKNKAHRKMLADMKIKEEPEAGTTHNLAVSLIQEEGGKTIMDAQINMKVVDPAGKAQIKMLKPEAAMKSHNGYFDLSGKGKYEVLVLFRIEDRKRSAGILYEVK